MDFIIVLFGILFLLFLLYIYFFTYTSYNYKILKKKEIIDIYNNLKKSLILNINNKGIFGYLYDIKKQKYESKNNDIRQFLGSRLLSYYGNYDEEIKQIHKKNLDFIFHFWYKEKGDYGYIYLHNKSKIGAIALFIRVLIYSPFFKEYIGKIDKLINSIILLQKDNGELLPWFIEPNYKYDKKYLMYFYSGEVILTLIELYEKTNNKKYLNIAKKSIDYYYSQYILKIDINYYPAYVPWITFSFYKYYYISKNKKYIDAIFLLNDMLLELQDKNIGNNNFYGRFYKQKYKHYGTPHSASDSIYTESLLYAYELAYNKGDIKRQKKYKEAIDLSIINLKRLQYYDKNSYLFGGIKNNISSNYIRIDNIAHTLDMFEQYKKIFN